jgi:hypothetical protein
VLRVVVVIVVVAATTVKAAADASAADGSGLTIAVVVAGKHGRAATQRARTGALGARPAAAVRGTLESATHTDDTAAAAAAAAAATICRGIRAASITAAGDRRTAGRRLRASHRRRRLH